MPRGAAERSETWIIFRLTQKVDKIRHSRGQQSGRRHPAIHPTARNLG